MEWSGTLRLAHDLIREAALAALPKETARACTARSPSGSKAEAHDDLQLLFEALEHQRAAGQTTLALATRVARSPRRRLLERRG